MKRTHYQDYWIPTKDSAPTGDGTDSLEASLSLLEYTIKKIDSDVSDRSVTIIKDPKFVPGISTGQVMFLRADNFFDAAMSDGTIRANAVGVADVEHGMIIIMGLVKVPYLTGITPGKIVYLSSNVPGQFVVTPPVNNPLILGTLVGDGLVSLSISTAVTEFIKSGIPDGSIGSEKFLSNAVAPFASDIKIGDKVTGASAISLGQIGITVPVYKGTLNNILSTSRYSIKGSDVANAPDDFLPTSQGIIETFILDVDNNVQVIWSQSSQNLVGWIRRKINSTYTSWYYISDNYSNFFSKDFFFSTLILNSPYTCCYYDTLIDTINITFSTNKAAYLARTGILRFSLSGQYIEFNVVTGTDSYNNFQIIVNASNSNYKCRYSTNSGVSWTDYTEGDNTISFSNLRVRIEATGSVDVNSFGVLYSFDTQFTTPSDVIVLSDTTDGKNYIIESTNGVLGTKEL